MSTPTWLTAILSRLRRSGAPEARSGGALPVGLAAVDELARETQALGLYEERSEEDGRNPLCGWYTERDVEVMLPAHFATVEVLARRDHPIRGGGHSGYVYYLSWDRDRKRPCPRCARILARIDTERQP